VYAAMTKDEVQRSIRSFYEPVNIGKEGIIVDPYLHNGCKSISNE